MAKKKDKKNKNAGIDPATQGMTTQSVGIIPPTQVAPGTSATMTVQQTQTMTPEQLQQMQLEEAIKESQDPSMRLKKLRNPISVKSCLFTLLALVVLTLVISFVVIYFELAPRFNLLTVLVDMLDKFGITDFFQNIGNWFKNLFS